MKRRVLIKRITECGAVFVREGAKHEVYRTGKSFTVPRHAEVNRFTAEAILADACDTNGPEGRR